MNSWNWTSDGWVMAVAVMSAVSCALPGCYLVLRRMSLMGDAISHAVLPGLAIAFLWSQSRSPLPMFIGAVLVGTLTALLTQAVSRSGKVEEGAAMGVIFSVFFALGLILIRQAADQVDLDPSCVLYGNIENIGLEATVFGAPIAARNLAIVLTMNVLFIALFYKELRICAFDPALATTLGINANIMHYALMILVALTTVANFESVGSILVIAMLIIPPVCAHLLTDRLGLMIVLSVVIAGATGILGRVFVVFGPGWIGADFDTNTAALMAVIAGGFLLLALLFAPEHGLIAATAHRYAVERQIIREDILGLLFRWNEMGNRDDQPMSTPNVLDAIGRSGATRKAIGSLLRRGDIERTTLAPNAAGAIHEGLRLTPRGLERATQLIRGHRLWEAYLEKHFELPRDHLHMPAERVEHYLTPMMRDQLAEDLTAPDKDPHGREIPD
ncbi:MAG: metal ABC transporter permease [Phycisphaerae bacterium]|nr:metal ABC transporter permease [Phycisphaerae bacterium]